MMKKMKDNILIWVSFFLFLFLLGFTYIQRDVIRDYLIGTMKTDTVMVEKSDTVWKTDSFFKEKPIPKYVEIVKRDTVYKNGKPIELVTENKTYNDTIECAEDTAVVTSYISGVNPNLDSLKVKLSRREIIKTNTITVTKYITPKKKFTDHFKVGVGVGYGYGMINKNFDTYLGVSINYEL